MITAQGVATFLMQVYWAAVMTAVVARYVVGDLDYGFRYLKVAVIAAVGRIIAKGLE